MNNEKSNKPIPTHVVIQRAKAATGIRDKRLKRRNERSENYDVFQRIDMHSGNKDVCWEWRGAHGLGTRGEYRPRVVIRNQDLYVYRVVYELYTGYKLQKGDVVRHSCDHSWCCNPYHMQIGTQRDNVNDMLARERIGMKHYQVKRIMQMLELGCTAKYVCAKMKEGYNMSLDVSVIKKIRMRRIYRHIPWQWGDDYATTRKARLAEIKRLRLADTSQCAIMDSQLERDTSNGNEENEDE